MNQLETLAHFFVVCACFVALCYASERKSKSMRDLTGAILSVTHKPKH